MKSLKRRRKSNIKRIMLVMTRAACWWKKEAWEFKVLITYTGSQRPRHVSLFLKIKPPAAIMTRTRRRGRHATKGTVQEQASSEAGADGVREPESWVQARKLFSYLNLFIE